MDAGKYRVPLTVIVFNNRAYMAVKNQFRGSEERVRIAAEMGAELVGPDLNFARLADTFGIFGQRVEQPDAIEPRAQARPWNKTDRRSSMS